MHTYHPTVVEEIVKHIAPAFFPVQEQEVLEKLYAIIYGVPGRWGVPVCWDSLDLGRKYRSHCASQERSDRSTSYGGILRGNRVNRPI